MENRHDKIILEAEEGITFEVSEVTSKTLIIRAISNTGPSKNYMNPPIPEGYKHVLGNWYNGFVIERISDGSQFVWIPVGILDSNGTLNGQDFSEKFGRRSYRNDKFSSTDYTEPLVPELLEQIESVEKYGGFYISRYNISGSKEHPQSIKGVLPLVCIEFITAKTVASTIENTETIKSHLTFGAEYDSILEWFIKSKALTLDEVANNSTRFGNYYTSNNSPKAIVETGSREEWYVNNIGDFIGNVDEYTQEQLGSSYCVIRGGHYCVTGYDSPAAFRYPQERFLRLLATGFRAVLCLK